MGTGSHLGCMETKDRTRRIREIFEAAIELEPLSARHEAARQACAGDPELWAEVQALLEASDAAESFLPDTPPESIATASPGEKAGDRIGRFVLLEEIGAGGCGVVFRAEQTEPVRRLVAIKVIKLGMDTRSVVARFEAERQALAVMDHPNIARVFDGGATAAGRPYFAMELVAGARITDYCERHRLSIRERLALFVKVCQAVQHAHQKGVIHRDLKPSNVLVAPHDGVAVPKVIDFGIAKATGGTSAGHLDQDQATLTRDQLLLGTPAYMSPEQAELGGVSLDTRSDIYSLGVLLYELLTGTTPFDGRALLQAGLDEMRRIIREEEPPTPSTRLTRELRRLRSAGPTDSVSGESVPTLVSRGASVDSDLDWIVMKCLEKDRTRRYATANDLALDLQRHLRDEPVDARPPSRRYRLAKLMRRNRGTFAALATIAALLIAGIGVSSWQAVRARRAEQAALLQAYVADLRSAGAALEAGDIGQAAEFLRRHEPRDGETDRRGLEWRYVWRLTRSDELQSVAQDRWINCARLSPDGSLFAVNLFGGETRILRQSDGAQLRAFPGKGDKYATETLAFSPDGNWLASGSELGVDVRDTRQWRIRQTWPGGMDAVAFSPDGRHFARLDDAGAHLHETADWQLRGHLTNGVTGFGRLVFSPDGRQLAVIRRARPMLELWNVDTLQLATELGGFQFPLTGAFSPDGRWFVAGNSEGELAVWELATRRLVTSRKVHDRYLFALAISPDGQLIATGGGDHLIHLWMLDPSASGTNALTRQATLRGHRNELWSLSFSPDGRRLLSAGRDGTAKLWDPQRPAGSASTLVNAPNSGGLGFLPRGKVFVTVVPNSRQLQLWDGVTGRMQTNFSLPNRPYGAVVLDRNHAGFGTTNGHAEVWRLPEGNRVHDVPLTKGPLLAVQTAAEPGLFLGWDRAQDVVTLWDLNRSNVVALFPDFAIPEMTPGWSTSQRAAFSPDARWLAYASSNYTVKLWDVARRAEAFTLKGHVWHIQCLRFSPDGTRLITGSWDGLARVWATDTGLEAIPPLRHPTGVGSFSVSGDGRTVLTRSGDDRLHFWSATTGAETLTAPGGTVWFFNLLSPDDTALAWEEGYSGRYRVHALPTLDEIDQQEATLRR